MLLQPGAHKCIDKSNTDVSFAKSTSGITNDHYPHYTAKGQQEYFEKSGFE